MSVKLGRPGALVGWGGGTEGRPALLTDRVRVPFFCIPIGPKSMETP